MSKRLDFNDNLLKANQVSKKLFLQGHAFILNGDRLLSDKRNVFGFQFNFHGFLVDRFQEARAKLTMYLNRCSYNGVHFVFQYQF